MWTYDTFRTPKTTKQPSQVLNKEKQKRQINDKGQDDT